MNFDWSAVPIAIGSWIMLEAIRFASRFFSKKVDITREYRMEMVRKRIESYEELFLKSSELFSAVLSKQYTKAINIISVPPRNSFYMSHSILYKWAGLGVKCIKIQDFDGIDKLKDWLNHIDLLGEDIRDFSFELRKEIYTGKIEKQWLRKPSKEEVINSVPEFTKLVEEKIEELGDPNIKSIKDLMK